MTWEETNKDMGAYQQALDAQSAGKNYSPGERVPGAEHATAKA